MLLGPWLSLDSRADRRVLPVNDRRTFLLFPPHLLHIYISIIYTQRVALEHGYYIEVKASGRAQSHASGV